MREARDYRAAGRQLLQALDQAVEPARKAAGIDLFRGSDSKLSRIVSGELNVPAELLVYVLLEGDPAPLLDALCELAGARWEPRRADPAELLERACAHLAALEDGLEGTRADVGRALALLETVERERERRRPLRAGGRARERGAA